VRQPVHRRAQQCDPLGANGSRVALAGLADHDLGVVDAADPSPAGAAGQLGDGQAGAEADDILSCPNFTSIIAARLAGSPLEEAHPH